MLDISAKTGVELKEQRRDVINDALNGPLQEVFHELARRIVEAVETASVVRATFEVELLPGNRIDIGGGLRKRFDVDYEQIKAMIRS